MKQTIGEANFDIPFIIQSHAESMKKILRAIWDLPANFADTIESGQQLHIDKAWMYLQHPLWQWGAGNVYLLVLSSWKVDTFGHGDLLFLSNLIIWSHIMTDLVHTHSAAQTQRIPRRKHMRWKMNI